MNCDFSFQNGFAVCQRKGCNNRLPVVVKAFPITAYHAECKHGNQSPSRPSLVRKAWTYATAVAKWTAAGNPVRSQQRINEILAICQACPMFADTKGRTHCRLCGCSLSAAPDGLNNKIAMATESCPLDPPKWTAEV